MKTTIQIEDEYKTNLHIKRKIAKIVNLLFKIEEVEKYSAIKGFDVENLEFGVVLTDDETIHSINKQYRKKDTPTDVITFALFADDEEKFVFDKTVNLGEIIVSVDTAKKQMKQTLELEILTLICHGILHLLGFDHLTKEDYNFVVKVQDSVISNL